MGLETATFIDDLNVSNPVTDDLVQQGDNHIRLIKQVLKNTFPGTTRAHPAPSSTTKGSDFTIVSADLNKMFGVTASTALEATLPTLDSGDAGWYCSFIKFGTAAFFIKAPTGSVFSGGIAVARARRTIIGAQFDVYWDGSNWFVARQLGVPVGSVIDYCGNALPPGFEWPNGQILASAATDYPEYNAWLGSGATPDIRGRTIAGRDDMGGTSANRLTVLDGDVLGGAGGAETHVLVLAEMPGHTHTGTTEIQDTPHLHTYGGNTGGISVGHTHAVPLRGTVGAQSGTGVFPLSSASGSVDIGPTGAESGDHIHSYAGNTSFETANHAHLFTSASTGGGTAHSNLQPTIIGNKLLVVE